MVDKRAWSMGDWGEGGTGAGAGEELGSRGRRKRRFVSGMIKFDFCLDGLLGLGVEV